MVGFAFGICLDPSVSIPTPLRRSWRGLHTEGIEA